ncbi:hypothetical protein ACQB60_32440 [Actinomycetota bacterium Odt1-20B]
MEDVLELLGQQPRTEDELWRIGEDESWRIGMARDRARQADDSCAYSCAYRNVDLSPGISITMTYGSCGTPEARTNVVVRAFVGVLG